jgi:hypothetical protein
LYPPITRRSRTAEGDDRNEKSRRERLMRYEFERDGATVASVLWEGPGQVVVEASESALRSQFDRFFSSEVMYLGGDVGAAAQDEAPGDVLQSRRRDWNPWEFERACRNLAHRLGCSIRRVETGPVEGRPEEVGSR